MRISGWSGIDSGLSVLDFGKAFEEAAELGPYVESLGYRRYWFGEHPPQPSAEIFVALLAAGTSTIRVGTGGIVLRLRNVTQNACNLHFLHWAFGGRIDMGFCMGGAIPEIEAALSQPHLPPGAMEEFDARVDQWTNLLRSNQTEALPEIWSLGTGLHSARRAAAIGASYALSLFHKRSSNDPAVFDLYRSQFRPYSVDSCPRTMLAFSGLCAESDAEADRQIRAAPGELRAVIWGSVASCADRLAALLLQYRPDELMLYDMSPTLEHKRASYRRWVEVVTLLAS